jgi:hypothetical protein
LPEGEPLHGKTVSEEALLGSGPAAYFCSGFIIALYQAAAKKEDLATLDGLSLAPEKVEPASLAAYLRKHPSLWEFVAVRDKIAL